jgi:NAD(P)-dependent dehydrogenase (short-subunit alcohol dehydrogenase family)
VAQKFLPHLIGAAKSAGSAQPALIVTSSLLPQHPIPQLFVLSLVKAAQRNMLQSMQMTYEPEGVFVGVINIQGQVSPEHETLNPTNIAQKTWEWFSTSKGSSNFEVII